MTTRAELYLNGILVKSFSGYVSSYVPASLGPSAEDALRSGRNTLAIHCHQSQGGQYIDAGLILLTSP